VVYKTKNKDYKPQIILDNGLKNQATITYKVMRGKNLNKGKEK
jgi:hypothetical protein